jgi:hypothetical protein
VTGEADLALPAAFRRERSTNSGTVAHLALTLAPGCVASFEVGANVVAFSKPVGEEIAEAMAFWFYAPLPPRPRPVPIVARRLGRNRAWALGVPPPDSEPLMPGIFAPEMRSPYYGIVAQRLLAPDTWAWLGIGVRTPLACFSALPRRAYLRSVVEAMLESTRFHARFGPARA